MAGRFGAAVAAVIVMAGANASAIAQAGRPDVVVEVAVMKEVMVRDEKGIERIEMREVGAARPGDTLVYTITYTNRGDQPALSPRVQDEIPEGTQLVPDGWNTGGSALAVSVDGGSTFSQYPVRRPVKLADGSLREQEVNLDSYTHVRWSSSEPLPPGESREVSFKVLVR